MSSTRPTLQNKNGQSLDVSFPSSRSSLLTQVPTVANGQLSFFAKGVGFHKDGYCRSSPDDAENTSVAAEVTEDFLNNQGAYLKSQGVQPGSKWCLSTKLWKEAFDRAQKGDISKAAVPKVYLHASHDSALKDLSYRDLRQYEAPREISNLQGRQRDHAVESPEKGGGIASQANDLGGDMGTTAPAPGSVNRKTEGA